jgi:hypothetical protein
MSWWEFFMPVAVKVPTELKNEDDIEYLKERKE